MNRPKPYINKWKVYFIIALFSTCIFITILKYKDVSAKTITLSQATNYELNDSHFHLTNYIQKGTDIRKFLNIMGDKVERVALFGIPLQQQWSYRISGDHAPKYYLETDAPLYYYSFTDAYIAMIYKSLSKEHQARFDPMITGFNPTDMYAADHIKRVLLTFPGVFSGIGEFTIHKEFVSPKVAGDAASLLDPALDSIFSFAEEVGLAVIIHNDIDVPFAKEDKEPAYFKQMKDLLKRHPKTSIIWAHIGLGRVIHPVQSSPTEEATLRSKNQIQLVRDILNDPKLSHVHFDISWDEVAKYIVRNDTTVRATATLINQFPDKFLFGTDVVAPDNQKEYLQVYYQYDPLWKSLSKETKDKVCKGNYVRVFDQARKSVRAWEQAHINIKTK
ncbi:MAG: amidohydrolase [Sporocytophaga sp.]|nr:amidohydrolase [Sporocytophaga sp.]